MAIIIAIGWALVAVGTLFIIGNLMTLIAIRLGNKGSLFPFFGGLVASLGLIILRGYRLESLWWLPLLLDFTCVPAILIYAGQRLAALLGRKRWR